MQHVWVRAFGSQRNIHYSALVAHHITNSLTPLNFHLCRRYITLKVLGSLLLRCDRPDCSEIVELRKLSEHLESGCRKGVSTYPASKLTIEQVLSRPLTSPPTSVEKKAAAIIVKRMFTEATAGTSSSSIVQLPTAGSVRGGGVSYIPEAT